MNRAIINSNRKGWIDALRGLAIILVIYGHCAPDFTEFFIYTSPVKMPLFFAISGYVINDQITLKLFFEKLVKKVVVPWIVLGLFFPLLLIPINGVFYPIDYFINMISGDIFWFMPCFIIAQPIHFILCKCCKHTIWMIVASVFCFIVGDVLQKHGLLDYAMFNRALVVQFFFLIGFLLKRFGQVLAKTSWPCIMVLSALYFFMCWLSIILFPSQTIDVHLNYYYNIPYSLLTIILGCSILFVAAQKSSFTSFTMSFIGQNTLLLYMWHGTAIMILMKLVSLFGLDIPSNWFTAFIKLFWGTLVCGISAILINRYVPWAVGKNIFLKGKV